MSFLSQDCHGFAGRSPQRLASLGTVNGLSLRLCVQQTTVRLIAVGDLRCTNAHLLSKTAVGVLRRFPAATLQLDLSGVGEIDGVGMCAIQDCRSHAERRGVLFVVVGPAAPGTAPAHTRPRRSPPRRRQTGTICC